MKIIKADKEDNFYESLEKGRNHWAYEAEGLKLEVADLIEKMMKEQGINRSTFAEIVGVSPAYITKALRGYANLTLDTLAKFGFALGHRFRIKQVPLDFRATIFSVIREKDAIDMPKAQINSKQYKPDDDKETWRQTYDLAPTG